MSPASLQGHSHILKAPVVTTALPSQREEDTAPTKLNTENLSAIFSLAVQLHRQREYRAAEGVYLRILATDPNHIDTLHLLGVLYHQLGEDATALNYLNRAASQKMNDASFFRNLGETYRALRRFDEAIESFNRALELEPNDTDSLCDLGHAFLQQGDFAEAEACYRRALVTGPDASDAMTCLGVSLMSQQKHAEADESYRMALEINPSNGEARHMLAALNGQRVAAAPPDYVASLFDRYANWFDRHLVEKLGYTVPQIMRQVLEDELCLEKSAWRIADLGCGTGLCGEQLRDFAVHMIGVDLSPRMVDKAKERGVYDELLVGDLKEALNPERGPLDLVAAGDVFVYLGKLDDVFARSAEVLRDGGLMVFSTEQAEEGDYQIRQSGRFAHSDPYISDLAASNGFEVACRKSVAVRQECGEAIGGQLYVLRKAG